MKIHGAIRRVFIGDRMVLLPTCTGFQQDEGCVGVGGLLFSGSRKGARRWQRGKEPVLSSSDSLIYWVLVALFARMLQRHRRSDRLVEHYKVQLRA
jgi:hypothetical protein